MIQKATARWNSFVNSMDKLPSNLRNFLYGGLGYMVGAAAGLVFLRILLWLNLAQWVIGLIPENQKLWMVLAIPLLAGLFLGVAGGITGVIGGWSVGHILGLQRKRSILLDSGVTFAVSQGVLFLVFLLLLSLFATYNNFSVNRIDRFGIIFGLFGLVFGLFSGIILALASVRLRHTWRVALGALLGFTAAGFLTGALLRLFSPADGFNSVTGSLAIIAFYLGFYFLGGGILGWTYGRLAAKVQREAREPQSVLPPRWQEISTAVIGIVIALRVLSLLGNIQHFLVIDPANLPPLLVSETQGVRFSDPVALPIDTGGLSEQGFEQPSLAIDGQRQLHLVWRGGPADQPIILYSRCQAGICSQPQVISNSSNLTCLADAAVPPSQPVIAVDAEGKLMAAWQAGDAALVYSTWIAGSGAPQNPTGCVQGVQGELQGNLGLASTGAGQFTLAYGSNEAGGAVFTRQFSGSNWDAAPLSVGAGSNPALAAGPQGELHMAYCTPDSGIMYQSPGGGTEPVEGDCAQPPALALGAENQPHLAWYASQLVDVNGMPRPASVIVESVRTSSGWHQPVIAGESSKPVEPALAGDPAGNLYLVWSDSGTQGEMIFTAEQPVVQCNSSTLNPVEQAGYDAIQAGDFRPAGQQVPYCDNQFDAIWYTPNPAPAFSDDPPTENGAFDRAAILVDQARYEVLFTTMQWEPVSSPPSPGYTLADGVARLYQRVKEHPEDYPRGMNVRILLGNYPVFSTFEWGDQIWSVMEDLRNAGLEKLVDDEIGWRVEVANYAGTYPHAHTKFLVVDGSTVVGAGFNYGYLHLPKDHPSGGGYDLFDLALDVTGPVAQDALAAYDVMWQSADQLECQTLAGDNWQDSCVDKTAEVSHSPEVLHAFVPAGGQDTSFSLLRTYDHPEADTFVSTALKNATQTIDMMQVNFSLDFYCMADLIFPGICNFDSALPYMTAMMEAIERDHVHVRVMMENSNSNGLENRAAGQVFLDELKRRGLDQYVELRFYNGKVHAKSTLVDGELLMIGSMNMHYSSWGANALAEYVVTTSNQQAIDEYEKMYETKWAEAVPFDEAQYNSTP